MTKRVGKPVNAENEGAIETFDMYRFFSRYDVIAVALVILGLLLFVLYRFLIAAPAAPV